MTIRPTPYGKNHLKFPFWLFESLPNSTYPQSQPNLWFNQSRWKEFPYKCPFWINHDRHSRANRKIQVDFQTRKTAIAEYARLAFTSSIICRLWLWFRSIRYIMRNEIRQHTFPEIKRELMTRHSISWQWYCGEV